MKQTVVAPDGLRWTVRRLVVPTGMRPMTRTEMLDAAAPRRTVVDGMSRQVPDAIGARAYPWGRRYPPIVLTYAVRGGDETRRALVQVAAALARGDGAPVIDGAEMFAQARDAQNAAAVVGSSGPRQFGK